VYGERQGDTDNHRTRVYQVKDGAGVVTSELYDFKGNLLRSKRELLPDYKHAVNWQLNPVPNDGTFTTSTTYDALSRPLTVSTPDNSVYRPTFNEANLLDKIDVNLRSAAMATPFVTNINYNAKGQRELIAYGNGAETAYTYDPLTFRLMNLKTTRPPGLNGLASQLFANPTVVQDLRYTYDPVGNITRIEDAALKTIFHNQEQVDPISEYTYDAIYRLIEAKGREHIGQTAIDFDLPNNNQHDRDYPFFGLRDHSNDAQAMRNYTERYEYDEVGNFDVVSHLFSGGGWNRSYEYEADSLLEPATHKSNRLTKTTAGNGGTFPETYTYTDANGDDVHGCMTSINAMTMAWDFEDQLQQVNLGTGGTAYYVYDAGGQRVRKVIETEHGTRKSERIYLVGFEVYHEFNANGTAAKLERQSLHVMDDKQRIALIETKTIENGNEIAMPEPVQRYQLGNHLGSASLELATDGALITYEEYHPYGTTAFQTGRSTAELSLKRYRYTGKERDEETGLNYHAARYYAPWLGRWVSCDPAGLVDGSDLYRYAKNNPVRYSDPKGLDPPDANPPARFGGSLGDFRLRLDPTFMPGSTPPPPTSSAAPGSAAASAPSPEPPVTFRPDASLLPPKLGGAVDFAHRFQLSGRVDTSGIHAEALLRTSPSTDLTLRADSSFGDPLHPRLTLSSGGAAGRGSVVYDTANDQFTFRVQGGSLGTPGLQGDASVSTSGAFSLSTQARIGLPLIDPVRFSLGGNFSTGALSVGVGFGGPLLPDLTQVQPGVQSGGEALTATAADALTIISREGPAPSIATIQGFVARHNAPPAGSTGPSDFARIGTAAEAVQGVARPPQGAPLRGSLDFGINPSHPSGQTDVRLMLRLQITLP
jgi:RHS repeat-associated protein